MREFPDVSVVDMFDHERHIIDVGKGLAFADALIAMAEAGTIVITTIDPSKKGMTPIEECKEFVGHVRSGAYEMAGLQDQGSIENGKPAVDGVRITYNMGIMKARHFRVLFRLP